MGALTVQTPVTNQVTRMAPPSIYDPSFVYVPSDRSDIRVTFARLGWVPPSRQNLLEYWK